MAAAAEGQAAVDIAVKVSINGLENVCVSEREAGGRLNGKTKKGGNLQLGSGCMVEHNWHLASLVGKIRLARILVGEQLGKVADTAH